MSITHEHLKNITVLYINQLLRENDWEQALLITSFIPSTFMNLRKYLVYSILQRKAMYMLKELPLPDRKNKY